MLWGFIYLDIESSVRGCGPLRRRMRETGCRFQLFLAVKNSSLSKNRRRGVGAVCSHSVVLGVGFLQLRSHHHRNTSAWPLNPITIMKSSPESIAMASQRPVPRRIQPTPSCQHLTSTLFDPSPRSSRTSFCPPSYPTSLLLPSSKFTTLGNHCVGEVEYYTDFGVSE